MMKTLVEMYNSKLWYDKRWVSKLGLASLYLQVTINGKHKEFPLKIKWPVENIDLDHDMLLPRFKKDPDVADFNLLIRMEQGSHTEIMRTYRIKKAPIDIQTFAKEIKVFDKKANFTTWMYNEATSRYNKKYIEKRTYSNHKSTVAAMIKFHTSWPFELVDKKFMAKFKAHLQVENYSPGGLWTIMRDIKSYLQLASNEPMIYVDKSAVDYPNPQPKWKTQYLNKDEVRKLMVLFNAGRLTINQHAVLKAFLFQCFTSLRISDVYRANSKWQLSDGFLTFIPKKNEKKQKWINVPIMPMAAKLISASLNKFFELPNSVEYNLKLKDIAKEAGIKKNLTSHVGRHTFGYLFMTTVGNIKILQEIMGHTKLETTMRYAHIDDDAKTESVKKIQDTFNDLIMWRVS